MTTLLLRKPNQKVIIFLSLIVMVKTLRADAAFEGLSKLDLGTSTIQSRAVAGFANNTVIFCLPGSTGACRTAWEKIISSQLDADFRPCNFVKHLVEA